MGESTNLLLSIINPKLAEDENKRIKTHGCKFKLPTDHLSPAQICMYLKCGAQYEFRYVNGEKSPPDVALAEGGSHHRTFDANNIAKMKHGKYMNIKALCNHFADVFEEEQKDIPKKSWKISGETKDSVIQRGKNIQTVHLNEFAPRVEPMISEHEVEVQIGDVKVIGIIDIAGKVDKRNTVFDYKIVKRKKSEGEAGDAISLSLYGWDSLTLFKRSKLGVNPPDVGFCSIIKPSTPIGTPKIDFVTVPLLAGRLKWFRRIVLDVADSISRGSFPVCDPANWWCDPRFCGYYAKCKGKVEGTGK